MDITRPWNISSHSVCLAWIMQVVSAYPCSSSVPAQSRACVSITVSPSRSLYCADGRFAIGNIHNYQHAASYPAFIASGAPCAVCNHICCFVCYLCPVPRTIWLIGHRYVLNSKPARRMVLPRYMLRQQLHLMFQGRMTRYADVQDASGAMQVLWTCLE